MYYYLQYNKESKTEENKMNPKFWCETCKQWTEQQEIPKESGDYYCDCEEFPNV